MRMKKFLATTLAVVMAMGTVLTVSAKTTTTSGGSGSAPTISAYEAEVAAATVQAGGKTKVGGKEVVSTIQSVILTKVFEGIAITLPKETIKANLGLKPGQEPKLLAYDFLPKASPAAMNCLNAAADFVGGKIVASLNMDLSAVENGVKVTLKDGSVATSIGMPKGTDPAKTYVMACVQSGGIITFLEDQDTDPATFTFNVQAGLGAYALIEK